MEHIPASATADASIDAVASKARSPVIVHIVAPIDAIIISPTAAAAGGKSPTAWGGNKMEKSIPRKKRGGMQLLRVAMNMVRFQGSSSNKKKKPPQVDQVKSKGTWKRMVGSMRPLTLQESLSPPRSPPMFAPSSPSSDQYEDVLQPPYSPASSSCGGRSRYASAQNLQELDLIEEDSGAGGEAHVRDACVEKADVEKDEEGDARGCDTEELAHHDDGDELIDSKADEFIAQFYEQMRLQRLN